MKKIEFQLLVIGLLLFASKCITAQSMRDSTSFTILKKLDEVVITASKIPSSLKETTRIVYTISKEAIERSGAIDMAQLLQQAPGLTISGAYSNPGALKSVFMRGASSRYTLILIDGVPVTDPSSASAGSFDLRLLPLSQVERIEILKGSQSLLYGSDAVAGVINIITLKGGDKPIEGLANFSLGSLASGQGMLNVGGKQKGIGYRITGQYDFSEGISEAKAPNDSPTTFDLDEIRTASTSATFSLSPIEGLTINPYVRYTHNQGDYDAGAFVDASNHYENDFLNTGGIFYYQRRLLNIRMGYGYTQSNRIYQSAFPSTYKGFLHDIDIYASYKFNKIIKGSLGVAYQNQNQVNENSSRKSNTKDVFIASAYANILVTPFRNLLLEVGGRFGHHAKFGNHYTYAVSPVYWLARKRVKIFGSYTTGYKSPTINQLYGPFGANEALQPEVSNSWEVGAQAFLNKGKITVMATYYGRNISDVIAYDFTQGYFNRDEQKDIGLETYMQFSITKNIQLDLSYDYVTGEVVERKTGSDVNTYNNLWRRPEHSVKMVAGYQFNIAQKHHFIFQLSGQFLGERQDIAFVDGASTPVRLDSYVLLNAYIKYKTMKERIHFFVDLKNITDTSYTEVYGYSTLGINVRCGMQFHF